VSKLSKSNDVKELQLKNILFIDLTCEVLKFFRFNFLSDWQLKNIYPILTTEEESIFDRSNEVKDIHPMNNDSKL
jgi:hypothetical protein